MTTYKVLDHTHDDKLLGFVTIPANEMDAAYEDDDAMPHHAEALAIEHGMYHPKIAAVWGDGPRTVWVEESDDDD